MSKFLGRLIKLIIALSLIVILGMAAVFLFVNPNQFKSKIEEKVLSQTGHVLSIAGPISWKWEPMLGLQLEEVTLNNQAPFKDKLLSAKVIRTELGLGSLFTGKIFLNLKLDGVDIVLERNAKGQANWESLAKAEAKVDQAKIIPSENASTTFAGISTDTKSVASDEVKSSSSRSILLNSVQVENANITYHDQAKNTHYKISQLQFSMDNLTKGLTGLTTPISLSLQLDNLSKQTIGKLSLKADWALKLISDELDIKDIALTFTFPDGKATTLNGETTILQLSHNPKIQGALQGNNLDMKPWLSDMGITLNPSLPTSADLKVAFKYQAPFLTVNDLNIQLKDNGNLSGNFIIDTTKLAANNMDVQGDFIATQIKYNQIVLDEVKSKVSAKAGMVHLNPMDIQIAQSKQHAIVVADLRGSVPKMSINNTSNQFEIKNMLAMFGVHNKLEGKTSVKLNLTATGTSVDQIRQSLNGNAALEMQDGKFTGINLIPLLKNLQGSVHTLISSASKKPGFNLATSAQSLQDLWKQKKTVADPNSSTPFTTFKVSMNIHNGLINSPDLLITHPEYMVSGQGTINLADNTLNYHTAVQVKNNPYPANDSVGNYLYSTSLPVSITGSLSEPHIRPDVKEYTNNAMKFAQKNIVDKAVQKAATKATNKLVEKALGKVGGDDKVNKAIEGALNSFFDKK